MTNFVFFFFQAEDGIRDGRVTGVQTCALPISGRILQLATPREIYERPATSFVGGFLGSPRMNLLPARVEGDLLHAGPFRLPRPSVDLPPRLELGVRPEHVALGVEGVPGKVVAVEPLGAESHLVV